MTRETDALANMMAADARRIDGLVGDVSDIKGDVKRVSADVGSVASGVNELRSALAVLVKHEVRMEHATAESLKQRAEIAELDKRLHAVETVVPGLVEMRTWSVRGMLTVLALVGAAIVGLVIKIKVA